MANEEAGMEKLPRFSYQVPTDLTSAFINEMKRDLRETPSDLLTAIVRKHFASLAHAEVVGRLQAAALLDERRAVPSYGARPAKSEAESGESKKANQE